MVLDYSKATKLQLLVILNEDCPIKYKYRAAFELMGRKDKSNNQRVAHVKGLSAYSGKAYYFPK